MNVIQTGETSRKNTNLSLNYEHEKNGSRLLIRHNSPIFAFRDDDLHARCLTVANKERFAMGMMAIIKHIVTLS